MDISATNAFEHAVFDGTFVAAPVVIAAITSVGEDDAATARVRKTDVGGFEIGLREQEANLQLHATESVDYIAWPLSSGEVDGLRYEVGRTADVVNHNPHYLDFQEIFDIRWLPQPGTMAPTRPTLGGPTTATAQFGDVRPRGYPVRAAGFDHAG